MLRSPVPGSSLVSSFWLLCCSGHSKWTQWNTWERKERPVRDGSAWGPELGARRLVSALGNSWPPSSLLACFGHLKAARRIRALWSDPIHKKDGSAQRYTSPAWMHQQCPGWTTQRWLFSSGWVLWESLTCLLSRLPSPCSLLHTVVG